MLLNLIKVARENFFLVSTTLILYIGWINRNDNYISAETGSGYLLGIIGGSLMLVLLLYPVSKRVSLLTRLIPIRYWFGFHMVLGIIGPVLILFHANFHLGSTNSTVALISMLLVAGSGLIGRYIYTHIHHGLYGSKRTLNELKQKTEYNHAELVARYSLDDTLNDRLTMLEEKALYPHKGLISSFIHVLLQSINIWRFKRKIIHLIKKSRTKKETSENKSYRSAAIKSVKRYTRALEYAASFTLYERLFSLWHILHLPLFFMMIITAIIHIFAVHMY